MTLASGFYPRKLTLVSVSAYPEPVTPPGNPPSSVASRSGAAASAPSGTPAQNRELRARGRKTMAKLLDAGVKVFADRGYHAARVDDIVKVAKASHGSFYLYFSNKEDLFNALVLQVAEKLASLASELEALDPSAEGYDAFCEWVGRFAGLYREYGPIIQAWTEIKVNDTRGESPEPDLFAGLRAELAEHIDSSTGVHADVAALSIISMIERFNYYVASDQVRADDEEVVKTLARVTFNALYPQAG